MLNAKFVKELTDEALAAKLEQAEAQIKKHKDDPEIVKEYREDLAQLIEEQNERLGIVPAVSPEEFLELTARVQALEDQVTTLKGKVEKLR